MTSPALPLPNASCAIASPEFWEQNRRLVKLDADGNLYFTAQGKRTYRPLLAKWGFALENVKTRERFREVVLEVTARELEENTKALRRVIDDPSTSAEEREMLIALLGPSDPLQSVEAHIPSARPLAPAKPVAHRDTHGSNVIRLDFAKRK